VFATRDERNVLAGLGQPPTEVSAYATRAENSDSHDLKNSL
jgi:hypothetical protein